MAAIRGRTSAAVGSLPRACAICDFSLLVWEQEGPVQPPQRRAHHVPVRGRLGRHRNVDHQPPAEEVGAEVKKEKGAVAYQYRSTMVTSSKKQSTQPIIGMTGSS